MRTPHTYTRPEGRNVGAFQLDVIGLCGLVVLLDGLDKRVIGYTDSWPINRLLVILSGRST